MEEVMDLFCQGRANPWRLRQLLHRGQLDRINGMEVGQQVPHALGAQSWDVGEA